jgi:hypothetical protein
MKCDGETLRGLEHEVQVLAWVQQGFAILTLLLLAVAYHQADKIPFSLPISLLHGEQPGGWGYFATLAGLSGVVLAGCWQAWRQSAPSVGLPLAFCLLLLVILACCPFPSRPHEPVAMILAVLGVVWMFARAADSAMPWRRLGPWLGLCGLPLLATNSNGPAAVGEGLLLVALAMVAGAVPADRGQVAEGVGLRGVYAGLISLLRPVLRMPGLTWGLLCLLAAHLTGAMGHSVVLPPLILATAWLGGWTVRRWDLGVLLTVSIRVAPVLLLLKAVGTDAKDLGMLAGGAILAVGAMVLARMVAVLRE